MEALLKCEVNWSDELFKNWENRIFSLCLLFIEWNHPILQLWVRPSVLFCANVVTCTASPILPVGATEPGSVPTEGSPLSSVVVLVLSPQYIPHGLGERCLWAGHRMCFSGGLPDSQNLPIPACPRPSASLFIPLPPVGATQVCLHCWELPIASKSLLRAIPPPSVSSSWLLCWTVKCHYIKFLLTQRNCAYSAYIPTPLIAHPQNSHRRQTVLAPASS